MKSQKSRRFSQDWRMQLITGKYVSPSFEMLSIIMAKMKPGSPRQIRWLEKPTRCRLTGTFGNLQQMRHFCMSLQIQFSVICNVYNEIVHILPQKKSVPFEQFGPKWISPKASRRKSRQNLNLQWKRVCARQFFFVYFKKIVRRCSCPVQHLPS